MLSEEWIKWLPYLLWYGAMLAGPMLAFGARLLNGRTNPVERDEFEHDKRRKQGGVIFNDILWDMRGDLERQMQRCLDRLAAADTSEKDRQLYAELTANLQRQIDRIYRLLSMKEGGD